MSSSYSVTSTLGVASEESVQASLKSRLERAERINKTRSFLLVLPLLAFIVVFFLLPIGNMLIRSVQNPTLSTYMPLTAQALRAWDGTAVPPEPLYTTLGEEMLGLARLQQLDRVGSDLNRVKSGLKSLLSKTARELGKAPPQAGAYSASMVKIDSRWAQLDTWTQLRSMAPAYSAIHYLAALDLQYDDRGNVVRQPESRRIYVDVLLKTLGITLGITVLCMLLGYPLAYMLATLPAKISNVLMILVLLPFWTSLLVRTTAWMVILQSNGVLNSTLLKLGIIAQPLDLMFNMWGTVIAMTHILLPFMVLPMYSVMKSIDHTYIRAAHSMGASSLRTFLRIYFPLSLPGMSAGGILVFILAIGYYITPALVGGRTGQVISNFIAYHMQTSLNWGLAAAIGSILLLIVLFLYWLYDRVVGISNMKLGVIEMSLPSYTGPIGRTWFYGVRGFASLVLLFLVLPVLVVMPLSFNVEPYFSFTSGMLKLDPAAFSTRWYHELLEDPMWLLSFKNSLLIAACATLIATVLGTLAALGLSRSNLPCKGLLMGTLISPMIVPVIISSAGMYFFYSTLGIAQSHLGIILAHAVLGTPFVIITVTATLVSFDHSLTRAASSLGASATYTFFKVTFPIIRPGIISGGLFAMVTSFDEAVVVQFLGGVEQRTIPRQMWSGMREQISPTILAAATLLILGSVMLLVAIEVLRRRSLRLRGIRE